MSKRWRPAPGYEGAYSVSDLGRVRRDAPGRGSRPGRLLSARPKAGTGRLYVTLSRRNARRSHFVHRLVALAFVPGRTPDRNEVNHLNGDHQDNRAENLEWTDRAGNVRHAAELGLLSGPKGEAHHLARLTAEKVRAIRAGVDTPRALAKRWGIPISTIEKAKYGLTWKHVSGNE